MGRVIIEFEPGKADTITVDGVKGGRCKDITKPFEKALGGKTVSDKPTHEMDEPETEGVSEQTKIKN